MNVIEKGSRVVVSVVERRLDTGELVAVHPSWDPFVEVVGTGVGFIDAANEALLGHKEGDEVRFVVQAKDRSLVEQVRRSDLVETHPREELKAIEPIYVGRRVTKGSPVLELLGLNKTGRVTKVDETSVEVDFNHPLAGVDIEVLAKVLHVEPLKTVSE